MNIFQFSGRNLRLIVNILVFIACCLLGVIALYMFRLTNDIDNTANEARAAKQIEVPVVKKDAPEIYSADSVIGKLKFGTPDSDGKVQIIVSVDAQEVARFLEKGQVEAAKSVRESWGIPPNVTIRMHNPDLCGTVSSLKYIVYVNSKPEARLMRDALRNSWASPRLFKADTSRLVFLIGIGLPDNANTASIQASIEKEFEQYKDIVQGDFIDTLRNGTLKGVMGLNWVSTYCGQAQYAVRANDDTFVNIFEMVRLMDAHAKQRWAMMCPLWKENTMPILRQGEAKDCGAWCVDKLEFPGMTHFPVSYCASVLAIISRELVGALHRASFVTPFFWINEIYVTGLLPKRLPSNIHYVDLLGEMSLNAAAVAKQYANASEAITVTITQLDDPELLVKVWKSLLHRLPVSMFKLLSDNTISQVD